MLMPSRDSSTPLRSGRNAMIAATLLMPSDEERIRFTDVYPLGREARQL